MKTLILTRHAKSSWKEPILSDKERPLSKRGKRDAPFMGEMFRKKDVKPDLVISSPAVRARDTAKVFCEKLGIPEKNIKYDEDLYEAWHDELLEVINSVDNSINNLMVFAHNPGLTDLSNFLADQRIDNIPTSGIAGLQFNGDSWSDLSAGSCRLLFFEYPKKYQENEK